MINDWFMSIIPCDTVSCYLSESVDSYILYFQVNPQLGRVIAEINSDNATKSENHLIYISVECAIDCFNQKSNIAIGCKSDHFVGKSANHVPS